MNVNAVEVGYKAQQLKISRRSVVTVAYAEEL
jgi:hypothetical protein